MPANMNKVTQDDREAAAEYFRGWNGGDDPLMQELAVEAVEGYHDGEGGNLVMILAAHRLSAYAPELITGDVVEAGLNKYRLLTGFATPQETMKAALLAAFATLRGEG